MTREENEAIEEAIYVLKAYKGSVYTELSADRHIRILNSIRDMLVKIDTPALRDKDELRRVYG